jgi:hypothetical protein
VPEYDLQAMLATLRVSSRPGSFAYVEDDGRLDPSRSHATIVEAEGRSAVVALDDALGLGLSLRSSPRGSPSTSSPPSTPWG